MNTTFIKNKSLELIKNSKIQGTQVFAYIRLLETKGIEVEKLEGYKVLKVSSCNYIASKVKKFNNGSFSIKTLQLQEV